MFKLNFRKLMKIVKHKFKRNTSHTPQPLHIPLYPPFFLLKGRLKVWTLLLENQNSK